MMFRAIFIAVAALAVTACSDSEPAPDSSAAVGAHTSSELGWADAKAATHRAVIRRPGTLVAPPDKLWEAGPMVNARIVRWDVQPGDLVEVGTPLATLVSPELSDLDAAVAQMRKVVKERERVVAAKKNAVEKGFQSVDSLYDAQTQLTDAQAQLSSLRRQMRIRDQNVRSSGQAEWRWVAAIDGRVAELSCSAGSAAAADATCIRIASLDGLRLAVEVPARTSRHLEETTTATSGSKDLKLLNRAGVVNGAQTETFWFSAPPELRIGESTLVDIEVPAPEGSVVVPRLAIVKMDGKPSIFIDGEDGPEPVAVTVHGRYGSDQLVSGIEPGTRVVARGAFLLKSKLAFP